MFRLLKALRKAYRADSWLLNEINTYLLVQCVMCGSLHRTLTDRNKHQAVCIIRFLSLSFYYGQSMTSLEPLLGLYAKEKVRELENAHALQQMSTLVEKVMEVQVFSPQKVANLTAAFDEVNEDATSAGEGGEDQGVHGQISPNILSSFQRIIMQETDLDLMFRTDEEDPSSKASKEKRRRDESIEAQGSSSILVLEDSCNDEDDDAENDDRSGTPIGVDDIQMEEAVVEEEAEESAGSKATSGREDEDGEEDKSLRPTKEKKKQKESVVGTTSKGIGHSESIRKTTRKRQSSDEGGSRQKAKMDKSRPPKKTVRIESDRSSDEEYHSSPVVEREKGRRRRKEKSPRGFAEAEKLINIQIEQLRQLKASFAKDVLPASLSSQASTSRPSSSSPIEEDSDNDD